MRKILCLSLVLCLLLGGCGGKKAVEEEEGATLNVGILNGDDKYAYGEDGKLKGIEPGLATAIAGQYEKELNIKAVGSETELYTGLQDGSFDLVFGRLPETREALKSFMVSTPYGKCGIYFAAKKYDYTDSLMLLGSGTLGVMGSVKPLSDQVPGVNSFSVEDYTDLEELLRDVESGAVAIGLCSEREALSAVSDSIQVQKVLKGPEEYYVAAMKNDAKLKKAVDSAISDYYDSLISNMGEPGLETGVETELPETVGAQ